MDGSEREVSQQEMDRSKAYSAIFDVPAFQGKSYNFQGTTRYHSQISACPQDYQEIYRIVGRSNYPHNHFQT